MPHVRHSGRLRSPMESSSVFRKTNWCFVRFFFFFSLFSHSSCADRLFSGSSTKMSLKIVERETWIGSTLFIFIFGNNEWWNEWVLNRDQFDNWLSIFLGGSARHSKNEKYIIYFRFLFAGFVRPNARVWVWVDGSIRSFKDWKQDINRIRATNHLLCKC